VKFFSISDNNKNLIMSRIGKQHISIPEKTNVEVRDKQIIVSGPKGILSYTLPNFIFCNIENRTQKILLKQSPKSTLSQGALYGLSRALLANIITGVSVGYRKNLQLNGVGFRAQVKKSILLLKVGYSHVIKFIIPFNLSVIVNNPTSLTICGIQKEAVGQFAAKIRMIRPPEPYKGKGVKYAHEKIKLKEGKTKKK
jgi:large subunit ribosomal protein L6